MRALRQIWRWLDLAIVFIRELVASGLRVALLAVQPQLSLRPSIVAYPLTVPSDAEIALLAGLITLTPGTLSVDVSDDRKWLYVHCLDAPDIQAVVNSIAGQFEGRVMGLFR